MSEKKDKMPEEYYHLSDWIRYVMMLYHLYNSEKLQKLKDTLEKEGINAYRALCASYGFTDIECQHIYFLLSGNWPPTIGW